ncbi:MAG: HlyD family efflux transporter periplasmic adaptor subunit [Prevotellaceae bacterium]|jgi:HlyD family secretion protein|nr:HlyD family efflux transporter periplasmic adaptor subunit [Prevotellaceae bacterium]
MPSTEINNIELRSEEVQEILGRPPRWIIRWGIAAIFVVIGGLFVGSYFFKYPEIISAPVVVTTENLPVNIMAKTTGRIDTLLVKEKQDVRKDQLLAVVENPASMSDVFALMNLLDNFQPANDSLHQHNWPANLQLGTVQNTYSSFLKACEDYRYFLQTDYHRRKLKVIEKQIAVQQNMLAQSRKQLSIMREQLKIADRLFEVDSTLSSQRLIAPIEYEKARSAQLQSRRDYENAKTNLETQKMSILQSEQAVFDLEQQRTEQLAQLKVALINAYDQLQAELRTWEQTYLFRSPVDGTVTFTKYWQPNQNVLSGEVLLTVVPGDAAHITGKIYLPPQGAGKVKVGQTVNIKFDNFPYMEYGMVKVTIKNIALVPILQNEVRHYVLEVDFPEQLITNYGKTLAFSQEMQGTAEIITEDLRLLNRFLNPIRALIKK